MQKNIFMTLNPSIREGLLLKYAKKKKPAKIQMKSICNFNYIKILKLP